MSVSREDNGGQWCKECERYYDSPHTHDPRLDALIEKHYADGTIFSDHRPQPTDVEQWATTTMPVLLGECVRQDDYGPFCVSHDSGWREEGTCHWVHDRQVFAYDVVNAWEGRDRG